MKKVLLTLLCGVLFLLTSCGGGAKSDAKKAFKYQTELSELETQLTELEDQYYDEEDDDKAEALESEIEELELKIEKLEEEIEEFNSTVEKKLQDKEYLEAFQEEALKLTKEAFDKAFSE